MKFTINNTEVYAYSANFAVDPDKPSLIFIHGAANNHSVFSLQSRYFAYHGYNVIALDLPGHGKSGGTAMHSINEYSQWLQQIIDHLQLEDITLIGHSMGALITLETASQSMSSGHNTINQLVLCGCAFPMRVAPALLEAAKTEPQRAYDMINEWSLYQKIKTNATPGFWQHGRNMRIMQESKQDTLYIDLNACNEYDGGDAAAASLNCPVLLISGKQDKMAPPKACQTIYQSLTDATMVLIDDCGHTMMSEQPDQVLHAIKKFLHP